MLKQSVVIAGLVAGLMSTSAWAGGRPSFELDEKPIMSAGGGVPYCQVHLINKGDNAIKCRVNGRIYAIDGEEDKITDEYAGQCVGSKAKCSTDMNASVRDLM